MKIDGVEEILKTEESRYLEFKSSLRWSRFNIRFLLNSPKGPALIRICNSRGLTSVAEAR